MQTLSNHICKHVRTKKDFVWCLINFRQYLVFRKELQRHGEMMKCQSVECSLCNKFFANSKTVSDHQCQAPSHNSGEVAENGIQVIKSDPTDPLRQVISSTIFSVQSETLLPAISFQPVVCSDCGMTLCSRNQLHLHESEVDQQCKQCLMVRFSKKINPNPVFSLPSNVNTAGQG